MTDNEIDAMISEKLGDFHHNFGEDRQCKDCYSFEHEDKFNHCPLREARNYASDLNAMAEAVKTLETGFDGSQADDYQQTLWSIVNPGVQWEQPEDEPQPLYDVGYLQNMIDATARQRAEAFIKTVCPEKWKGNE